MLKLVAFSVFALTQLSTAHFILQIPPSLGYDDANELYAPCGGSFDIKNRDTVTEYPVGGHPFHFLSTHSKSIFQWRASLLNATTEWVDLMPPVSHSGLGHFCLPAVPGKKEWAGLDAVVQVVQYGPDGTLFQCAAVKFVDGPALATHLSVRTRAVRTPCLRR